VPSFRSERRVRHTAQEMFDLVADVERYPEFVPLCTSLRVRSRKPEGEGRETLIADMSVGYKLIRERFTSRVTLDRPQLRVEVRYVDGPFRHMENLWTFADSWARCSTPPSASSRAPSRNAPTRSMGGSERAAPLSLGASETDIVEQRPKLTSRPLERDKPFDSGLHRTAYED